MQIKRAAERFHTENDWLSAYWLLSFDFYYDPQNLNFGALRVFNHDTIEPASGFGMHAHRDMEIVTYILAGTLDHKDSTGGVGTIATGEVQRMTAGTGIRHSEYNSSPEERVRLLQMWVLPDRLGHQPSYEQKQFTTEERLNRLLPIASGQGIGDGVKVNQDVTFYVARAEAGKSLAHELAVGRRAFLYLIEGEMVVNGETLTSGDQARLTETARLDVQAVGDSEFILIDLA